MFLPVFGASTAHSQLPIAPARIVVTGSTGFLHKCVFAVGAPTNRTSKKNPGANKRNKQQKLTTKNKQENTNRRKNSQTKTSTTP